MTKQNTVTKEYMDRRIQKTDYHVFNTMTTCYITLDNNYVVSGVSACVDPVNFDAAIGKDLAFKDAYDRLWPLFGFLLAEELHKERMYVNR